MRFIFKTSYDQDIRLSSTAARRSGTGCSASRCWPRRCVPRVLPLAAHVRLHLRHRRRRADAAHRLYRPDLARPCRVPRGRRLYRGGAAGEGRPVRACRSVAAALLAALAGIVVGLPALRLTGIYLAIATLAFGFIVAAGVSAGKSVTARQLAALRVKRIAVLAASRSTRDGSFYYLALVALVARHAGDPATCCARRPAARSSRSATREISAQSMGINLARYQDRVLRALRGLTGLAGALYAHKLAFIIARAVQPPALDPVRHDDLHRRPRLAARRDLRRDLPHRCCRSSSRSAKDYLPPAIGAPDRASSRRCSA